MKKIKLFRVNSENVLGIYIKHLKPSLRLIGNRCSNGEQWLCWWIGYNYIYDEIYVDGVECHGLTKHRCHEAEQWYSAWQESLAIAKQCKEVPVNNNKKGARL